MDKDIEFLFYRRVKDIAELNIGTYLRHIKRDKEYIVVNIFKDYVLLSPLETEEITGIPITRYYVDSSHIVNYEIFSWS